MLVGVVAVGGQSRDAERVSLRREVAGRGSYERRRLQRGGDDGREREPRLRVPQRK
jgi:hypothetical protein